MTPTRPSNVIPIPCSGSKPASTSIDANATRDAGAVSLEKVRKAPQLGKQVARDAEDWLLQLLFRDSLKKAADTFGLSTGMVDALRRGRVAMKASSLIKAIENDRSILVALLHLVDCPLPFTDDELIAALNYRDAVKKSVQAELIAADVCRELQTCVGNHKGDETAALTNAPKAVAPVLGENSEDAR